MLGIQPAPVPTDPLAIDLLHEYEPPSRAHLLGTGDNGIDILSALLYGARLAAIVGLVVVSVSVATEVAPEPLDGRVLLLLATDEEREPRFQIGWGIGTGQVF